MANAVADHSDSSRRRLNLGTVGQLRVRVDYGRMLEGPSHDVFLLHVAVTQEDDGFDEKPYLQELERVLAEGGRNPIAYSLHVNRHHTSWGSARGEAEIRLNLTTGSSSTTLAGSTLAAVTRALDGILRRAGTPERLPLRHDDAIARARFWVEEAFPSVNSERLSVSDDEHQTSRESWRIGLRAPDLDRYVVVVGFLDGHVDSVHVRHHPRSEVLDSVGSETQ